MNKRTPADPSVDLIRVKNMLELAPFLDTSML